VELGESLAEAVRREVREEVGLDVSVGDLAVAFDRVIRDADEKIEYHYILLDFVCESEEGTPHPSSDALDCAFVPLDKLGQYTMTKGTEEVIRRVHSEHRENQNRVYAPGH
jgi:8-oxo-dGTP diphosphatase